LAAKGLILTQEKIEKVFIFVSFILIVTIRHLGTRMKLYLYSECFDIIRSVGSSCEVRQIELK